MKTYYIVEGKKEGFVSHYWSAHCGWRAAHGMFGEYNMVWGTYTQSGADECEEKLKLELSPAIAPRVVRVVKI